ncbi:MAG: hypothetical protein ACTHLW_02180 [Verrucomicrobiota bacterium]
MASEVTYSASLLATKGGAQVVRQYSGQLTMAGDDMIQSTQDIGTAAEQVTFGDIAGAPSQVLIKNLDTVNYVEIGGDAGLTVFKLKILAGGFVLISPSSGTVYAKANAATVKIEKVAVEA